MPNFTPNLNLKKPLQTENYNIDDQNGNMDLLDTAVTERLKASDKATQSDAETGTDNAKYMTPLATKQAVLRFAPQLEYKDVTNLSATTAGVITWTLPMATDNTRTGIILCRATKDISNMDYASCLADSSVTKTNLGRNEVTNTYTGLTNATQYWVKTFIEYVVVGKKYYSNGVTVTFTYSKPVVITEFYNAGNEFTTVTGGWSKGTLYASGTLTKKSDRMTLTSDTAENVSSSIVCQNMIDLANIKTLKVEWDRPTGGSTTAFGIRDTREGGGYDPSNPTISRYAVFARQIDSIDTSAITSSKFLTFHQNGPGNFELNVYRVWGES